MFDQKSAVSKYVGYFLIGFFLLIIILSFGMPDLGFNCGGGGDRTTIAVVNGQKVHYLDFFRYRDTRFSQFKNQKMDSFILDSYIMELLMMQRAESTGFRVTDERISNFVKKSPEFRNPSTGKFDVDYFQAILKNNHLNLNEFEKVIKKDFLLNDFRFFMSIGGAASTEDALVKNTIDNSAIQIQYSFLSTEDLKKRFQKESSVTDAEIEAEIKNNNVKISDPTTDRGRIRKQLEDKKIEKIKNDIAEKINSIASSGGTFAAANSVLNGKTGRSSVFKIGEQVKTDEKEPKSLAAITGSPVFTEKCLKLEKEKTSSAIISGNGIYIYSLLQKNIPSVKPDDEKMKKISDSVQYASANMITRNLMKNMNEKSKIRKNLKTD